MGNKLNLPLAGTVSFGSGGFNPIWLAVGIIALFALFAVKK